MFGFEIVVTHLLAFFLGLLAGGGITYKLSIKAKFGGGVSQNGNIVSGDMVAGNKVDRK